MVVELGVGDHGDPRRQLEQRAVGLVGLDHEPLPRPPAGVGPGRADLAADEVGRVHPAGAQRVHDHARGRRLAVGAGDRDRRPQPRDLAQQVGAVQLALAALAGDRALRVVGRDRARDHELGVRGHVGGVVPGRGDDPVLAQGPRVGGVGRAVGAGHRRAERVGDEREAAHPGAAHADEVQPAAGPGRARGGRGHRRAPYPSVPRFSAGRPGACAPRALGSRVHRPCRPRGLRLRVAAPGPARGDRGGARRPRHARGHVDGVGQVGDLPDRGAAHPGRDRRRLAADRAPARPGRGAHRASRRRRRAAELVDPRRRARARAGRAGRGRARVPLPRARAARQRRGAGRARGRRAVAARRRRGALHLRVGPRLPAGLPAPRPGGGGARAADDPGADRDRRAAGARRDRRAARTCATRRSSSAASTARTSGSSVERFYGAGSAERKQRALEARVAESPEAGDRLRRHAARGRGARRAASARSR